MPFLDFNFIKTMVLTTEEFMLVNLLNYLKLFLSSKTLALKIKLLEQEQKQAKLDLYLRIYKFRADLEFEKIKLNLEKQKEQLFQKSRKPLVQEFDSGLWNGESGANLALDTKIEEFQIQNGFIYKREINRWRVASDNKRYSYRMLAKVLFSDDLVSILDPKDAAFRILVNEAKDLVPHLLLHPNDEVRSLVETYLEDKKKKQQVHESKIFDHP